MMNELIVLATESVFLQITQVHLLLVPQLKFQLTPALLSTHRYSLSHTHSPNSHTSCVCLFTKLKSLGMRPHLQLI